MKRYIICERDVGLFSLIQQVISHTHLVRESDWIPIVFFSDRCAYWTPEGYQNRDTVWEYYFEPLNSNHPAASIPKEIQHHIGTNFPNHKTKGYYFNAENFVTNNFGNHRKIRRKALQIPYKLDDPVHKTRVSASQIILEYIRPREYIRALMDHFYQKYLEGHFVIGVHIRGTDAASLQEKRYFRQGILNINNYIAEIQTLLDQHPSAKIFVATDAQSSLETIKSAFGERVIDYNSLRHTEGDPAGKGPTGWIIPAYIATDPNRAAQNGMEAIIEYLLLTRCNYLIHNGAGLARTVLLTKPSLAHKNTHRPNKLFAYIRGITLREILDDLR